MLTSGPFSRRLVDVLLVRRSAVHVRRITAHLLRLLRGIRCHVLNGRGIVQVTRDSRVAHHRSSTLISDLVRAVIEFESGLRLFLVAKSYLALMAAMS